MNAARAARSAAPETSTVRADGWVWAAVPGPYPLEGRVRQMLPKVSATGVLMLLAGAAGLWLAGPNLVLSFAGLFALLLGAALVTPILTYTLMGLLAPVLGSVFGSLGRMAARAVVASLSRSAVAVAALVGFAFVVGLRVLKLAPTEARLHEQPTSA